MSELFLQIEEAYFNDDFKEVVNIWEQYPEKVLSLESKEGYRTCIALADSYKFIGEYRKSIRFCNKLIQHELKQAPSETRQENLLYHFSIKSGAYRDWQKLFLSYLSIREYIKKGGTDKELIKYSFLLEEHLILPFFRKFTNWFTYLYGTAILIHYLIKNFFEIRIVSPLLVIIFASFGLVWIGASLFFRKQLEKMGLALCRSLSFIVE